MFRWIRNLFGKLFSSPPGSEDGPTSREQAKSDSHPGGDLYVRESDEENREVGAQRGTEEDMKYLIVGLGNFDPEYVGTRHNIGFDVVDRIASDADVAWESKRLAEYTVVRKRGKQFHLIKPTTYMNRSGRAVRYWLDSLKLQPNRMLVVVDDLHLRLGTLRIRQKGGDGGHNGLADINQALGHSNWARLRFGIGKDFGQGQQVNFVLGRWEEEEIPVVKQKVEEAARASLEYHLLGPAQTMERYNRK